VVRTHAQVTGRGRVPLEQLGHWEGLVFHFNELFQFPDGARVLRADLSQFDMPPGVTPAEVMEALTDPAAIIDEYDTGMRGTDMHPGRHAGEN
jgi:hypothetical protein